MKDLVRAIQSSKGASTVRTTKRVREGTVCAPLTFRFSRIFVVVIVVTSVFVVIVRVVVAIASVLVVVLRGSVFGRHTKPGILREGVFLLFAIVPTPTISWLCADDSLRIFER